MKRYLKYFIILLSIISFRIVKAETFVEGKFISGEYISKRKDGAIHYMTVQYLKDSNGDIVYCLEPYTKFVEGKSYTSYEGDLLGYNNLSEEDKRTISLIIYYGYGYSGRTASKWYAITQYLIWDTITNSDGSIYFTDKLNGTKITKYKNEIAEIREDVREHENKPSFVKNYEVDYNSNLTIEGLNSSEYNIKSDYKYIEGSNITVNSIINSGKITISKLSNYYKNKVAIFDSTQSQDLIRPGNVINKSYDININVNKGNIELDIKKDDSVYTVESDFSNTCYEIYSLDKMVDSVCTKDDNLIYDTIDLAYGDYQIKQVSVGIGYLVDSNIYKVTVSNSNKKPVVNIYNHLIRNDIIIKKYACKDQICNPESDAKFGIYDIKGNLVNHIVSDKLGDAKIQLGYGTYKINQISGLFGYTKALEYQEKIVDEDSSHFKELFNYYIEEDKEVKVLETPTTEKEEKKEVREEKKEDNVEEEEKNEKEIDEEVPNTQTDGGWLYKLVSFIINVFVNIYNKLIS